MPDAQNAVRFFEPDRPRIARTLKEKIEQERQSLAQQVVSPNLVADWADFKHRLGVIEGLTTALQMYDELEQEESR